MENSAQFTNKKQLRSVGIIFLLVVGVVVSVYLAQKTQIFGPKASSSGIRSAAVTPEQHKGTPVPGEVIVKYRNTAGLSSRTLKSLRNNTLEKRLIKDTGTRSQVLPLGFEDIEAKYNIKSSDKVFTATRQKINPDARSVENLASNQIFKLTFDKSISVEDVARDLSQNPLVEYAEPNYKRQSTGQGPSNDPYYMDEYPDNTANRDPGWDPTYDYQWPLKQINAQDGWALTANNSEVWVAVVDTGVDYTHPEFGGCTLSQVNANTCAKVAPGLDVVNEDNDPMDDMGHGTHVSGIIAASINNSIGIAPVAPNARIIPIKVLDAVGSGDSAGIAEGIIQAVNLGANVINMSFGGFGVTSIESGALDYAFQNNVVVVAAAGNSNLDARDFFPASYLCQDTAGQVVDCVITVSATDQYDIKADYSNWGSFIDVAAPGGVGSNSYDQNNVLSLLTQFEGNYFADLAVGALYARASGTSMAAPHVAGLAALVLGKNSSLSPSKVRNIILNGADDKYFPGFDMLTGFGRINAGTSLANMDVSEPPLARISSPETDMLVGTKFKLTGSAGGANFASYKVEYSNVFDQENLDTWYSEGVSLVDGGKSPVIEGDLATIDMGNVPTGYYYVRLTTITTDGKTGVAVAWVFVDPSVRGEFPIDFGSSVDYGYVVADLNGDGQAEIIYKNMNKGVLHAVQANGQELPGWPIVTGETPEVSMFHTTPNPPIATDFDTNYPGLEVVVPVNDLINDGVQIHIYHADGTPMQGWTPEDWALRGSLGYPGFYGYMSAGTVQGQKVLIYREDFKVHVLKANGQELPGWPRSSSDGFFARAPILANFNGTEKLVIPGENGIEVEDLYRGEEATSSAIAIPSDEYITKVVLADTNKDGDLEIIASTTAVESSNPAPGPVSVTGGGGPVETFKLTGKTYIWDKNLNLVAPSPLVLQNDTLSYPYGNYLVAVADLNQDGNTDILSMFDRQYYAHDIQGNLLPGYPTRADLDYWSSPRDAAYVTTGSGSLLMAIGEPNYWSGLHMYEFTDSMRIAAGFRKSFNTFTDRIGMAGHPALVDLDVDGSIEVVAPVEMTSYGWSMKTVSYLYVFNTTSGVSFADWPQKAKDAEHSNTWWPFGVVQPSPSPWPSPSPSSSPGPSPSPSPVSTASPTPSPQTSPSSSPEPTPSPQASPISSPSPSPISSPSPSPISSPEPTPSPTPLPMLGDVNGDGFVNALDLGEVIEHYAEEGQGIRADLNGDGFVNALDLGEVIENYGN